jgi:hypothetical protein
MLDVSAVGTAALAPIMTRRDRCVGLKGGGACAQYISLKKICKANKTDSQAHIDDFYLCYMKLKIP